jgi:hypothetical protein
MSTAAGSPESDSRKVSKSKEDSSIQQGTPATAAGTRNYTISNIQKSPAEWRPATKGMPEIVEMPTTVLASAGTPTAQ